MGGNPPLTSRHGYKAPFSFQRRRGREQIVSVCVSAFELSADPPATVIGVIFIPLIYIYPFS